MKLSYHSGVRSNKTLRCSDVTTWKKYSKKHGFLTKISDKDIDLPKRRFRAKRCKYCVECGGRCEPLQWYQEAKQKDEKKPWI